MDKIHKLRAFCTASLSSFDLSGFTRLLSLSKPRSQSVDHRFSIGRGFDQFPVTKFEFGRQRLHQVVHLQANNNRRRCITNGENDENKNKGMQGANPTPNFSFPQWARWVVGSVFTLLLPFLKLKWGNKIQAIEEAEVVIEGVEKVAEVVEKVAEEAEKLSEEVAESLPDDGNNKLKQAALWLENASKLTAHDAQLTQDFIHKVEEVDHDLHDLETIVDPIIEKIIHGGPKENK